MDYNRPGKHNLEDLYYSLDVYCSDDFYLFDNIPSVIKVYGMEGFVDPHIHICTDGRPDICIKLYTNEYFGRPTTILNTNQCSILNEFINSHWDELIDAWDSSDGNIVYSKWESVNTCPNYLYIELDKKVSISISDTIDLPFGIGHFSIINSNLDGICVSIDVSGYNTIYIGLISRIAIIKDNKIDKSFRSEIYDAINNKIRWRAPISNPYLYLYQYLIMHSMHIGMNVGNDYQKYYYDNKKIKIIY